MTADHDRCGACLQWRSKACAVPGCGFAAIPNPPDEALLESAQALAKGAGAACERLSQLSLFYQQLLSGAPSAEPFPDALYDWANQIQHVAIDVRRMTERAMAMMAMDRRS